MSTEIPLGSDDGANAASTSSNNNGGEETDMEIPPEEMARIQNWRTVMVIFDFVLSYPKWSLTLFLFLASLSVTPVTDIPKATQLPYQRLQHFVQEEANAYYECTENAFALLDQDMIQAADREKENVLQHQAFNFQLLKGIENTTNACVQATRKAQESLFHWNNGLGQRLPFVNISTSNCSSNDQSFITTSLGQDLQEVEGEVFSIVGEYRDSSETSLALVRNYAQERSDYDYNYFLRNKIEPVLVLLEDLANNSFHSVQFSVDPRTIVEELLAKANDLKANFDRLRNRIDILTERVRLFHASLEGFKVAYSDLLERALKMVNETNPWLLSDVPSIPGFGDLGLDPINPDVFSLDGALLISVDSLLPAKFTIPDFGDLPDIDLLLDTFAMEAQVLITDTLQTLASEANAVLKTATKEILDQIRSQLTLDDYNPPQYQGSSPEIRTLDEEADYLAKIGDAAEANTQKALDRVHTVRNVSTSDIPSDVPEVDPVNHSFSGNTTTFDYETLSVPGFFIFLTEVFEWLVGKIVRYGFFFESALQLFRIARLKWKYEKDATPQLPEIKYGPIEKESGSDAEFGEGWQDRIWAALVLLAGRFLTPQLVILVVVLPALVVTGKVWYPHVTDRCVESQHGTDAAKKWIIPYTINQASAPGNALHTESEFDCRQQQRLVCDRMLVDSELAYRNDVATLANFQNRHNQSVVLSSRLERCIATDVLDMKFRDACCGLEGYPSECPLAPQMRAHVCPIDDKVSPPAAFLPLGTYLSVPECRADTEKWTLRDSRFDCQALRDSCSATPCTGVDEDLIRVMVVEADCQAQLSLIQAVFFVFLAIFHAVMANLVCPLIRIGVKYSMWEKLNPYGIRFSSPMNKDGVLLRGASDKERAKKVKRAIAKYEAMGWLQLFAGILGIIAWIVVSVLFLPNQPQFHG